MDNLEAKMILDFLCLRWRKSIIDDNKYVHKCPASLLSFEHVLKVNNIGFVYIDFHWTERYSTGKKDTVDLQRLLYFNDHYGPSYYLQWSTKDPKTMKDILQHIFTGYASSYDIFAGKHVFIFKGESLEEIKVKMDLEDLEEIS